MIAFCILAIIVPAIVYSKVPKTKIDTKIIENIYKEINWKPAKLSSFPTGTYQKTTKAVIVPQRASTQATGTEQEAKMFVYYHESGNRTNAINASSGACGLGQALPCSKMNCSLSDYACQDAFFTRYMKARYGTWQQAKSFWLQHGWW